MKLYFSRQEQYAVVVLLLAIIGALFVLSYAYGKRAQARETQPFFVPSSEAPSNAGNATGAAAATDAATMAPEVVVHVAGAVKAPGVYHLPAGGRVNDAVQCAGGVRADGYGDALNLAEKLQDGERVYVPTRTEWQQIAAEQGPPPLITRDAGTTAPSAATPARRHASTHDNTGTSSAAPTATTQAGHVVSANTATTHTRDASTTAVHRGAKELPTAPIHLNTATDAQLQQLPGVGDSTAQKILAYRHAHGKFTDTTQLIGVGGIGQKKFSKMAPYLKL